MKSVFLLCFFEDAHLKNQLSWSLKGVNKGMILLLQMKIKDQVKKVPPLGGEMEPCGCSSCVWGLRSLLNTKEILTLPKFLLSDGCLIHMWSDSVASWCRMLLSLSFIVKSSSSAFGCFVEMWWFLMALVVWFLWSGTLSFRDLLVLSMYSAVQLWADGYVSFLSIWNWIIWVHK